MDVGDLFSALVGCVVWIPLAIWIVSLIHWMIMGDIDVLSGLVGLGIALALGLIALDQHTRAYSPFTLIAVVATIVMYPFVRAAMNKRELRSVDVEALEKAYRALSERPGNPIAKLTLARRLYDLGVPGHALAIAESALATLPAAHFRDEHRQIRSWKAVVTDPRHFAPIACVECHTANPPGNTHCAACGSPFLLDRVRGRFLGKGQGRKLLAVWVCLVAVIAGIPETYRLPPLGQICAVSSLVLVAGIVLFLAFRDDSKGFAA